MKRVIICLVVLSVVLFVGEANSSLYSCSGRCGQTGPYRSCRCDSKCFNAHNIRCCEDYHYYCAKGCDAKGLTVPLATYKPDKLQYKHLEDVTYTCNQGYHINLVNRTCTNGKWGEAPLCRRPVLVLCYPPVSIHSSYKPRKGIYFLHETVTYVCDSGYQSFGTTSRRCQFDGTWTVHPICANDRHCPRPLPPSNGVIKNPKLVWNAGDVVQYSCNQYYALVGNGTAQCGHDGTWQGSVPRCEYASCLGRCHKGSQVGLPCQCFPGCVDTAHYTCCPTTYLCPVHDVPLCPEPESPDYGWVVSDHPISEGSTAKYYCIEGFVMFGSKTATCSNGRWDNPKPTCATKDRNSCVGRCNLSQVSYIYYCECKSSCVYSKRCCKDFDNLCAIPS